MRTFFLAYFVLRIGLIAAFSIKERHLLVNGNQGHKKITDIKDCISMHAKAGDFRYTSSGTPDVCGVYIVGDPDTQVEVLFHHLDVSCDSGGLIGLVDGWEAKGEFFPGEWDTVKPIDERYQTFCSRKTPLRFRSAQNVALIQHRIPVRGQGFTITVRFLHNKRPCNAISMDSKGTWTISNYGQANNCSFSLLTPQYVEVLTLDVGTSSNIPDMFAEAGVSKTCSEDKVEFLSGIGLDPSYMWLEDSVCGRSNHPRHGVYLPCPHSVVRLTSSKYFFNKVTFRFRPFTEEEKSVIGEVEC